MANSSSLILHPIPPVAKKKCPEGDQNHRHIDISGEKYLPAICSKQGKINF